MILDILYRGDLCSLAGAILILLWLGKLLSDDKQKRRGVVLAGSAFLAFSIYVWDRYPPQNAEDLFVLCLRSLVAFGFILGLSWVVLPLMAWFWEFVKLALRESLANARRWQEEEEARLQAEQGQRDAEQDKWKHVAEKHVQEEQTANREQELEKQKAGEARRRSDALAACDVLFQLHSAALGNRFPKEAYQEWVGKHLGDDVPIDQFEARARQLLELIDQLLPKETPAAQEESCEEILAKFREQQALIEKADIAEEWKQTLLGQLREEVFNRLQKSLVGK